MAHDQRREEDDHDRSIRSEERLCQIDGKWIAHAEVHDLEAQALALQHVEYERRLSDLNHEAQRIAADKLTFASKERVDGLATELGTKIEQTAGLISGMLPREVFDTTQKEVNLKAETLALTISGKPSAEQHEALAGRVKNLEQSTVSSQDSKAQVLRSDTRLQALEDFKNRALGFGALVAIISGAVGAVIAKALGG